MIIGITGLYEDVEGTARIAGAGKDAVADVLIAERECVRIGLADPLKRICRDIFAFSDEQLWGGSEFRNAPDPRYLRQKAGSLGSSSMYSWAKDPKLLMDVPLEHPVWKYLPLLDEHGNLPTPPEDVYLSPRHALQQLGTEFGRSCYQNVWIDYALRVAKSLEAGGYYYDQKSGLRSWVGNGMMRAKDRVVFSDLRFFNEYDAVKAAGGKIVRVKRKFNGTFPYDLDGGHASEQGLATLGDNDFDYVIENYSDMHVLKLNTLRMFDVLTGRIMEFDEEQADVPPFMRKPR